MSMHDPPTLKPAKLSPALNVYHHRCIAALFGLGALQKPCIIRLYPHTKVNNLYGQTKPGN